jgi:hypothetical protein
MSNVRPRAIEWDARNHQGRRLMATRPPVLNPIACVVLDIILLSTVLALVVVAAVFCCIGDWPEPPHEHVCTIQTPVCQ